MKVSDIIKSACLNSQVVPSTNIGDIPGDIYDIAKHKLRHDVLGTLNVDRTLDVSVINRVVQPVGNKIRLECDPETVSAPRKDDFMQTVTNWDLVPPLRGWKVRDLNLSDRLLTNVLSNARWNYYTFNSNPNIRELDNAIQSIFSNTNQHGLVNIASQTELLAIIQNQFINITKPPIAFATSDHVLWLCIVGDGYAYLWRVGTTMRWIPYFVDSVVDFPSGLPHTQLSKSQWDSIDFKFIPYVYSVTNGNTFMELEFKSTGNVQKNITIPVPVYISGDEVVAQPKFYQYLVDCVAEQLAVLYNMSSFQTIQEQKIQSYGTLKRQHPNPIQPPNVRLQIRATLQSGQSRWFRFDGFNGG